jgi:hypothetical protein
MLDSLINIENNVNNRKTPIIYNFFNILNHTYINNLILKIIVQFFIHLFSILIPSLIILYYIFK